MNRGELLRLRRCRLLLFAMLFGLLLPVFQPSWTTLAVALVGEALLGFAWWRRCRGLGDVIRGGWESRPGEGDGPRTGSGGSGSAGSRPEA